MSEPMRNGRRRLGDVPGNGSEQLPPSGDAAAGRKHAGAAPAPRRAIARSRNEPRSTFHVRLRQLQRRIPWPRKPTWSPAGSTIGTTDLCTRTPRPSTSPRRPTCATSSASQYRHAQTQRDQGCLSSTRRRLEPCATSSSAGGAITNQGVHALNAIAYTARRKAPERDYFVQQIGIATDKLDAVEEGRRRLEGRIDELEGSIVVGDGLCRY